jgi:transposase-like protein
MSLQHSYTQSQNPASRQSNKTQALPLCKHCKSNKHIINYGKRQIKTGLVQIYRCTACTKNFTTRALKYAQYPTHIILNAISTYNSGHTQLETINRINKRFKTKISQPALSTWLERYSDICTFSYLRKKYVIDPNDIIVSKKFHHQQVYRFKYHQLKLNIAAKRYPGIKTYLNEILTTLDNSLFKTGPRCSSPPENIKQTLSTNILSKIRVRKIKTNNAITIASLSVELARTKRERHNEVANFFLINDSATLAIEVPVYLRPKEARAFKFPLKEPLTGHIDMLQMRRNKIHILDYKPEMATDKTAHIQLLLYAFALSKRTNIPLTNINCAYFNEDRYYQFAPNPYYYQN